MVDLSPDGRRRYANPSCGLGRAGDVVPELAVRRGREAIAFYEGAFGAVVVYRVGGTDDHAGCRRRSSRSATPRSGSRTRRRRARNFSPESLGGSTVRILLVVDDPARSWSGPGRRAIVVVPGRRGARLAARPDRGSVWPPLGDRQATDRMAAAGRAAARAPSRCRTVSRARTRRPPTAPVHSRRSCRRRASGRRSRCARTTRTPGSSARVLLRSSPRAPAAAPRSTPRGRRRARTRRRHRRGSGRRVTARARSAARAAGASARPGTQPPRRRSPRLPRALRTTSKKRERPCGQRVSVAALELAAGWCTIPSLISSRHTAGQWISAASACASVVFPIREGR